MFKRTKFLFSKLGATALFVAALVFITGCESSQSSYPDLSRLNNTATNVVHAESIVLREGDVLKITFPTAPNLNTPSALILRDGTINLPVVGQVHAAGQTIAQLQSELAARYSAQVETKQVTVELMSSAYPIFVTGAVLTPKKVLSDHPMTALEAIMEAGGPDYARANLKSVTVLRHVGDRLEKYTLDLKKVMKEGQYERPFYMQPGDIIYVKEKFTWF